MILFSAFQFGSLPMLGWLAAALLPWLIHRYMRQRYQTMPWAAVELLLVAVQQRARRVHFQQWLLLAVRTLIIALAAIAVAEPAWRDWSTGASGDSRGHLMVVIDQSYSMSCQRENNSRLERAKQHAQQLVDRGGYEVFSVIGWSQIAGNVIGRPTEEASLARAAIEGLEQRHSTAQLSKAVLAVSVAIDRTQREWPQIDRHHVVFISDQTRTTWAAEEIKNSGLAALAERANLSVVDVGDEQRNNLTVVDITADSEVILRQQEIRITASLRGFGSQPWNDVAVELKIDGQTIETAIASLPAAGEMAVTFSYQFADEGQHTVQVSLAANDDALLMDDRRVLVIDVRPRLRIACIAGTPKAADDVARAMEPYRTSEATGHAVQAEVVPIGRLLELDLSRYDTVFLCGIQNLTPSEQTRLVYYVRSGGGLALLADEQTDIDGELGELLPVEIGPSVTTGDYRFDPLRYVHPILKPFRGQTTSGLLRVAIAKYRQLLPQTERESAQVALAFNTGDPALVVDEIGAGRLAVLAIPASLASRIADGMPWSSFPVSPSFLPMMQELARHLAANTSRGLQNVLVGQPATCRWDASRRPVPIEVRGPGNLHFTLPALGVEDNGQVVLADTRLSGIYTLSAAGDEFARVAVNLDPAESNLSTVELKSLPKELSVDSTHGKQGQSIARDEHSWVRSLLALAIVLLLLENALACWQGRAWQ